MWTVGGSSCDAGRAGAAAGVARPRFEKGRQDDKLRVIVGNGLVTALGDYHRRHRRLVQPAFHRGRIAEYARTIHAYTVDELQQWRDGEPIDADRHFARLTLRVVGKRCSATRPCTRSRPRSTPTVGPMTARPSPNARRSCRSAVAGASASVTCSP